MIVSKVTMNYYYSNNQFLFHLYKIELENKTDQLIWKKEIRPISSWEYLKEIYSFK